jgi:FHS family glucose/mannose:H+ symporter-like MFS transporter
LRELVSFSRGRDSLAAVSLQPSSQSRGLISAYRKQAETLSLHAIFFLTGLGTLTLGPVLPAVSHSWHLDDRSGGLLLGAQFLGSFAGAVTLESNLRKNLLLGCSSIVIGFSGVSLAAGMASGFSMGLCGFLLAGFGLGRTITSINLIAGARFIHRRASAISLLNLTWGLGALSGPVMAYWSVSRLGLAGLFASLSAVSAVVMACCLLLLRHSLFQNSTAAVAGDSPGEQSSSTRMLIFFAVALFAYGGIEASFSGWMSSLTARSAGGTLHLGATATSSLWIGVAAGRALAALLLLRVEERKMLTLALLCSGVLAARMLLRGDGGTSLVLLAFVTGLALAPIFPSLCSLLLARRFSVRTVGTIMSVTALGAAIIPWVVGIVSQDTGALRNGLWVPVGLCALLAVLVPKFAAPEPLRRAHD